MRVETLKFELADKEERSWDGVEGVAETTLKSMKLRLETGRTGSFMVS